MTLAVQKIRSCETSSGVAWNCEVTFKDQALAYVEDDGRGGMEKIVWRCSAEVKDVVLKVYRDFFMVVAYLVDIASNGDPNFSN